MSNLEVLQQNPGIFISFIIILGAVAGSFLNVVIHRLPIMMERQWALQCAELDGRPIPEQDIYNLAQPASSCPKCGHAIKPWENIPIFSYLFLLRGKCSGCQTHISLRYPIVETITAGLSGLVAWHFGISWETAGALLLVWALISLTMIDFDTQLLPDIITLPFLWIGLTLNLFGIYTTLESAVIGALAGYLSLWSIYWAFKLITGKEGMGYGDFKLLALLGAWMGWQALPAIILISSLVGAVIGIALVLFRGRDHNIPMPFGPFLAIAGGITFVWGEQISNAYFNLSGIS